VRVPDHNPSFIQRVLDIGAVGIIVPHVRTAAEAAAVVAAAKFAPDGIRGACPTTRWVGHSVSVADWAPLQRRANSDVLVFGLIEDLEGVENVEAITAEGGLDGVLFGPFDLSQAAGLEGDVSHPDVAAMGRRVIAAVRAAGLEYVSLGGWEVDDLETLCEYTRLFIVGGDRPTLFNFFETARLELEERLAKMPVGVAG
jgi:4-hydroxy-2-oxoheptanedioate aldolase